MASKKECKLPLIELSSENLKPGSSSWLSTCNNIKEAFEEHGCFEVVYKNKNSPVEFHERIVDALHELFELPRENKKKNVNRRNGHGFLEIFSTFPIYESTGIDYPDHKNQCQKFTHLMWPDGNDHFCETVHSYTRMVVELYHLLMEMLFESYGMMKQTQSVINSSTFFLVRMMHYRRPLTRKNVSFSGHTDKSFVTILHQNHVNGLEIRTKEGDWIPYKPSSSHSSFIVLAGDICKAWSNDRIEACFHRVNIMDCDSEENRYVIGLFSSLSGMIKAPEELIDEEHPLRYTPFDNEGFIDFYESGNTHKGHDSDVIKAFCGI